MGMHSRTISNPPIIPIIMNFNSDGARPTYVEDVEVLTEEHEESMKGLWGCEELRELLVGTGGGDMTAT